MRVSEAIKIGLLLILISFSVVCSAQVYAKKTVVAGKITPVVGSASGLVPTAYTDIASVMIDSNTITSQTIFVSGTKGGTFFPVSSGTVDSIFIIKNAIGIKYKRDATVVRASWYPFVVGNLEALYPSNTYAQNKAIRRENTRLLLKAANYAMTNNLVLIQDVSIQVQPQTGTSETIYINTANTFNWVGEGNQPYIDIYPKFTVIASNNYDFIKVDDGGFLNLKNLYIKGNGAGFMKESYRAALRVEGFDNTIKVLDNETVRPGFWQTVSIGDTLFYVGSTTSGLSYQGTVSAVDSVKKVITLGANLNAATTAGDSLAGAYLGIKWEDETLSVATVYQYSKKWTTPQDVDNTTYGSTGISLDAAQSVFTTYGKITLDNVKIDSFRNNLSMSGGWFDVEVRNSTIKAATEVGLARFLGDYVNPSNLVIDNTEISYNGSILVGNQQSSGDLYYGSGSYNSPSCVLTLSNSKIINNLTAGFRQTSDGGGTEISRDGISYYINNRFEDNAEYALSPSNAHASVISNNYFKNNLLKVDQSSNVLNNTFLNTLVSLSSYGNDQPDPNVDSVRWIQNYNNNTFINSYFDVAWSSSRLNKTIINFTDNSFITDSTFSRDYFSVEQGAVTVNIKNLLFDCPKCTSTTTLPALFKLYPDNIIKIDNLVYPKSLGGSYLFQLGFNSLTNSTTRISIKNSDIKVTSSQYNRPLFFRDVSFENCTFDETLPQYGELGIKSVKKGNIKKAVASSNIARINLTTDKWGIDQDTVRVVNIVMNNLAYNAIFEGEVLLIALRDFIIQPYTINSASNIVGDTNIVVKKGQVITMQHFPYFSLGSEVADTTTLVTADGVKTNYFSGNTSTRTSPLVPGSVQVVADAVTGTDDLAELITGSGITGIVGYTNTGYDITFTVAPTNGTPIKLISKLYSTNNIGHWRIKSIR